MSEIYESSLWSNLYLDYRACLVPLIEEVRPGANVELWKLERKSQDQFIWQKIVLELLIGETQLKFGHYKNDYYLSRDEVWLKKLGAGKINPGEFLGYPDCCVKNFYEVCKKIPEAKGPAEDFWCKAKKLDDEGHFDPLYFYVLHAPCHLDCVPTLEFAERIKSVLEEKDSVAANYLKEYNQQLLKIFG